ARLRDVSAVARDHATEAGDRAAEREEAFLGRSCVAPPTAAEAALRESAATMRARGAADRAGAAADRAEAADDRREARGNLARAQIDGLTGVYTRGPGLMTLEHEIERAHRSGEPFVLAFVDVDGLKKVNDVQGHAAGDELLRAVGAELRSNLRSYDPVVRVGGDEFVCAFSNTGLEAAAGRVGEIQEALSRLGVQSTISVGLAELRPEERLEALRARGDAELYRAKQAG
ncbi:MAG: GGDEF domain-containing protein, partial [Solirubrobacteraceae bacterium]